MKASEIIDLSNYLIEETIFDVTSANDLIFLNIKKNAIEIEFDWEWLKTKTILTSEILPTDFLKPLAKNSLFVGLIPYRQVSLADSINYLNIGLNFYINYTTNKIYLTDGSSIVGGTLNYTKKTDDLISSTSPVWPYGHELIAYDMAIEYLEGLDFDPINSTKATNLSKRRDKIFKGLSDLNSKLALASMNYQMGENLGIIGDGKIDINNL